MFEIYRRHLSCVTQFPTVLECMTCPRYSIVSAKNRHFLGMRIVPVLLWIVST